MQLNFSILTKAELRAYTVAHPDNKEAFHAFVDRFTSEASSETFDLPKSEADIEAVETLIRQKIEQLKLG